MGQVRGDPDEIERFARQLKQANQALQEITSKLQGQFNRLSETWRDPQHEKYAQEFEQTMRMLKQFQKASEGQIPLLRKRARHLREYLER
jgi:uncharacterized protein YukE